jgi:hypothetical protein
MYGRRSDPALRVPAPGYEPAILRYAARRRRERIRLGRNRLAREFPDWAGELDWVDRHSLKRSGHRRDLVAFRSDRAIAIEVELAPKSKPRLNAILQLHLGWIVAQKTHAVIYICSDQEGIRRMEKAGERVGLFRADGRFRIEPLDTIKVQAIEAFETTRTAAARAAV